jgi:hypothetical protein
LLEREARGQKMERLGYTVDTTFASGSNIFCLFWFACRFLNFWEF